MTALQGTIKNGQIIPDFPVSLPEGARVEIFPLKDSQSALGMREEDWPSTSDGIAALLSRMDQVEPEWLSPDDEAAWRAALREQKQAEQAAFAREAEKLQRTWQ